MIETISFSSFVAGSITPSPTVFTMLDGGLTFFVGTGVVLLGLVAFEKLGISINETFVRSLGWVGVLIAFLYFVLRNPLIRTLTFGF